MTRELEANRECLYKTDYFKWIQGRWMEGKV